MIDVFRYVSGIVDLRLGSRVILIVGMLQLCAELACMGIRLDVTVT